MKIITLMEDTIGTTKAKAEHGLCFFIETEHHKLLVDTGASDLTWENAKILGVDVSQADTVFISHGHYDHTGGLPGLIKQCPKAEIYMHESAGKDFYHDERYIGIDKNILSFPQLHLVEGNLKIDDELEIFSEITGRKYWPESNLVLSEKVNGKLIQDQFKHEQCLVIKSSGETLLVSGCAHNGILNILDKFVSIYNTYPDKVISGFHMMKKTEYTESEKNIIKETARALKKYPVVFYTGHCTGQPAFDMMKSIMGEGLQQIHVGMEFVFGRRD